MYFQGSWRNQKGSLGATNALSNSKLNQQLHFQTKHNWLPITHLWYIISSLSSTSNSFLGWIWTHCLQPVCSTANQLKKRYQSWRNQIYKLQRAAYLWSQIPNIYFSSRMGVLNLDELIIMIMEWRFIQFFGGIETRYCPWLGQFNTIGLHLATFLTARQVGATGLLLHYIFSLRIYI